VPKKKLKEWVQRVLKFKKIKAEKVQKMESKIKKKDGVHSKSVVIAPKGSIVKKSIKKAIAKEDTKMAVYADSTDSSPPESTLTKKLMLLISSKNLLKLLIHP
jgi:hypothetical protein